MKVVHICLFPPKGAKHVSDSGVASYAKNLLAHIPNKDLEVHVVCNQLNGPEQYREGQLIIHRTYTRDPRFLLQIHRKLKQLQPDVIHVQQELALFGNIITSYLVPLLVLPWRRRIIVTLHGVVSIAGIDQQFVKANGFAPAPVWMVRLGLRVLYTPLVWWSRSVVVHEPYFKQILVKEYRVAPHKVAVIPHGVEDFTAMPKKQARKQLDIRPDQEAVLFMGYAAGYKGIDLLLEGFAQYARANENALLIVGAGAHPRFKNDPAYQAKYHALQQKAKQLIPSAQYRWVGFIPEDQVGIYYSAADVSVYPYLLAIASSGPMSFAIGYNKPFLASQAFADVFDSALIFDSTPSSLAEKLSTFFADVSQFQAQISQLRSDRLWSRVGEQTVQLHKTTG